MARNKAQKPLTEAPPEADSSEESASTSSQELEEDQNSGSAASSSDEEQTPSTPPPPPASGKKAPSSTTASASASAAPTTVASGNKRPPPEDDSSSDDEQDEPTLHKIKPISKPGYESGTLGKGKLKYTIAALPAGQIPEKRASESELKSSSKKPRKEKSGSVTAAGVGGGVQEEGSKKLFQRVFSEDDEILILKGMIDFKAKRGADPMIEIDDFYGFIKKSLHVEVSKVQIVDKVRRLKKKFFNAKKKKLTNPIEIQCFELSKKIWENNYSNVGDDVVVEDEKGTNGAVAEINNGNVGSKSNSKARILKIKSGANAGPVVEDQKKKNDKEEEVIDKSGKVVEIDEKDVELEVGESVAWEELRKKGLKMMGAKARAEIGEMWEKVAMKQAEARILRSEAEQEETRRIIEALRSGKH